MGTDNNTTKIVYSDYLVVDNMVHMGTVNNGNNTWHVLICVVYNSNKHVKKNV